MNTESTNGSANEQSLIQLYMNLMGTTEAHARSVFIYLHTSKDSAPLDPGQSLVPVEQVSPGSELAQ